MTTKTSHPRLDVDLTTPEPVPEAGVERAVELLRSGRLFRYGETGDAEHEAALLEEEFAALVGRRYCVAVSSGGAGLFLALRSLGVGPGDTVLLNAFTLAPVPGAVEHTGATTRLVDITPDLVIDLDDLERQAAAGARVLLLSHMRGHLADLDAVTEICSRHGVLLVEDCAHSLGARWRDRPSGTFGAVGVFSAQTFKHLNAGEGGLLVTDDDEVAARAILASGSYMLYEQHRARPPVEVFTALRGTVPNLSSRLSDLAAAVLRPQLPLLDERVAAWNARHDRVVAGLRGVVGLRLPARPAEESYVGSSLQFALTELPAERFERFVDGCGRAGVHVKWFGAAEARGFTSTPDHWTYLGDQAAPPRARDVLSRVCDLRIPLALSLDDCDLIARVIRDNLEEAVA
ncbi:aminotransferase class I/II-fold pyridoxal phosphate-dependent enzyme [soil metagenome]